MKIVAAVLPVILLLVACPSTSAPGNRSVAAKSAFGQCTPGTDGDARGTALVERSSAGVAGAAGEAAKSLITGTGTVQGADPFVLRDVTGVKYAYTTNRPGVAVPVYRSDGENSWEPLGDALPKIPSWAERGHTWAPESIRLAADRYALFFTAKDTKSGKQCVGRAFGTKPEGPYVDDTSAPFVCDPNRDTSIDPSPFRDDDGKLYFLWKTKEGDGGSEKTTIWLAQMDDAANLKPETTKAVLTNDQSWEGKHVEAPTMVRKDGQYYLFYSAGGSTVGYLVSYATSQKIDGPYSKSQRTLVGGGHCLKGAGHQSIVPVAGDEYRIYFHSVHPERKADPGDGEKARFLDYAWLCFKDGKPRVQDNKCE